MMMSSDIAESNRYRYHDWN